MTPAVKPFKGFRNGRYNQINIQRLDKIIIEPGGPAFFEVVKNRPPCHCMDHGNGIGLTNLTAQGDPVHSEELEVQENDVYIGIVQQQQSLPTILHCMDIINIFGKEALEQGSYGFFIVYN
ncbi:MAG: hypothetical protein A4E69_01356 [Syntrophus sp. PtaB.Bin138]|nr:MAG: hypothetical protein A4E69_01356 [Syntrophus sp. PtaB.Bin138]